MAAEPEFTAADLADVTAIHGGQQPATDSWTPVNLAELPEKPPIEPTLGQTGLIYPGKRHVFSGAPESAKTLAAYCVLIQTVRHNAIAALLDFEMGAYDTRQRLLELGATIDEISRILYLEPDEKANEQRIAALIAYKPELVVIDAAAGAYSLEGLDDNRRSEVETFSQLYIAAFWRNGIATILIDHVVKNSDDRGRFQIGSERKLGAADVHFGFDTIKAISRGTSGRYKITTHKDRGGYHKRGHLADLHLDSDPDTHQIAWSFTDPEISTDHEGHFRPTGKMEAISVLLENSSEPLSRNAVYTAVGGDRNAVMDGIRALIREGFAAETTGSHKARPIVHARRYRENDPTCNPENPQSAGGMEWFGSGMDTTQKPGGMDRYSGGMEYHQVSGMETAPCKGAVQTSHTDRQYDTTGMAETSGWFDTHDELRDTYLDSLAPSTDDDIDFEAQP